MMEGKEMNELNVENCIFILVGICGIVTGLWYGIPAFLCLWESTPFIVIYNALLSFFVAIAGGYLLVSAMKIVRRRGFEGGRR